MERPEFGRDVAGVRVRVDAVRITVSGAHWNASWLFPQLAAIGCRGG